jgi:flavocytochrome c
MSVLPAPEGGFGLTFPVVIIGAGAAGLVAALAAKDKGTDVLVLERDSIPRGSTALSSGFIPACNTEVQKQAGIEDSPELMAQDIQNKSKGRTDPIVLSAVCKTSGVALNWLQTSHNIPFELVTGFMYPGHSVLRMHATPEKTGDALMNRLIQAVEQANIDILCDAQVSDLFVDDEGEVTGVCIQRPDGSSENIGCRNLVLACNGYGGNPDLIAKYIPQMASAEYFGHAGNQGDAILWGEELGANPMDLGGYQGHGSVAIPHNILITWALMMEGGIQVNLNGERFSNEHAGYSEQAEIVLQQPSGIAWNIYDKGLHDLGMEFDDYRNAFQQGAVVSAETIDDLAGKSDIDPAALAQAIAETELETIDRFGRDLSKTRPLQAPFYGIKVTGSLFHTQGGLKIDTTARVLNKLTNQPFNNLFAVGGAARGLSGPDVSGYLSGNGLLSAIVLGYIAGRSISIDP